MNPVREVAGKSPSVTRAWHDRMNLLPRCLFHAFLLTIFAGPASAITVEVSPDLPPHAALAKVREARKAGDASPATIVFPAGLTEVTQPLLLEATDSSLLFTGEKAALTGAPLVTGWQPHEGGIVKAEITALLPKGFLPKQLLCDGERQILARYPNFDAKDPLYGGWAFVAPFPPAGAPEGHDWNTTLYLEPADIRKWAHPEDVEIDIFAQYGWWNFVLPVASLDAASGKLTLAKPCSYDLHPHNRFHLQNALEELDSAGEWFYDRRTGWLYFWPPKPIESCEVRVPVLESFFKAKAGAKGITIRGLTLTGCHGSAITFDGAEDGLVEKCLITDCGAFNGTGVVVNGGKNVRVSRNEIRRTGSNAVGLSGGDRKTLTGPGHVVEDNHLHDFGIYNKNACGVSAYGVDLTIRHNHIHHGPRMGVQMSGNRIFVEYNHLHHLCLETQDGGAIYTGGRDWISSRGSTWKYNLIHDVVGCGQEADGLKHPWFTFGLYPDDNSGGLDIIGNVVYRVAHTPIHLHNSRDCRVENNVFALGGKFQFDLHGWVKDQSFYQNHIQTMIAGYESVAGQPAWKEMRNMDLHPRDAIREDGTMMSGNIVARNIMFGDQAGIKYGDLRNVSPRWNTIDRNLAWNNGHPIVTGINKAGPDRGEPIYVESFGSSEPDKTPKGWGFNHKPNAEVKLVTTAEGTLRCDCALGTDPKNVKSVFHGPDLPFRPGTSLRVRLRIRSSEATAPVSLAFAAYAAGSGYWQTSATNLKVTDQWQEVEAVGRLPREGEAQWQPWMKAFWLRVDCPQQQGHVLIDDVRITETESLDEWTSWQAEGWDQNSLVADPLFVDWKKDDFRLRPESPAFQLGFEPIPFEKIGIRGE